MSSIPRLITSKDSSRTSLSVQWEKTVESGGGGGESEEEAGESEQGAGEDEEERGAEVTGGGEGGGGGGGLGGGQTEPRRETEGITMTVEPFDTTSIRIRQRGQVRSGVSRRQSRGEGGSGSDNWRRGRDKLRFWRAWTSLLASTSRFPTSSSIPGRAPLRLTPGSRHRESHLKPDEECVRKVRPVARRARDQQKATTKINQKRGYGCRGPSALQKLEPE
jgi:hypothetical protein